MEYQDDFVSPSTGYFFHCPLVLFLMKSSILFFLMLSSVFGLDSQRASTTRICGNMRFRFPNSPSPVPLSWQDLEIRRELQTSNLLLCLELFQIPFCSVSLHFSQGRLTDFLYSWKASQREAELRPGTHCRCERCHNPLLTNEMLLSL